MAFVGLLVVAYFAWRTFSRWAEAIKLKPDETFAAYAKAHPECVQNGNVRCCHCGGRHLLLRYDSSNFTHRFNSHVCKNCGQELYRSASPL